MKALICAAALLSVAVACSGAEPGRSDPAGKEATGAEPAAAATADTGSRASKRYDEMLGKMQAAVEEIAQLYGNPVFLQVFTNDLARADELKERLRTARSEEQLRRELAELQRKRDDLLNDIALKEREAARAAARLVRQRAALDALSEAVEQAKRAVEETSK
jgi:uncharacterized protein YjiS (DUF1127 family)